MSGTCNKCKQSPPHTSDSWCIGCCALEALTHELSAGWGTQGPQAVVHDVLVTAVRQTRALRRLSQGGAGESRAHPPGTKDHCPSGAAPKVRECSAAPSARAPQGEVPKAAEVKKEAEESEEYETDSSESEETEAKAATEVPEARSAPKHLCPGATAKARPEVKNSPKKERVAGSSRATERKERRDERPSRSRARRRDKEEKRPKEDRREERERSRGRRRRGEEKQEGRRQGEGKKTRRAGTKHKRLYRAEDNPYQRFHNRLPGGYWDQPPQY